MKCQGKSVSPQPFPRSEERLDSRVREEVEQCHPTHGPRHSLLHLTLEPQSLSGQNNTSPDRAAWVQEGTIHKERPVTVSRVCWLLFYYLGLQVMFIP